MIEIQKNSREVIRISESEYEGHKFVDLRVWYSDNGEMKPTKKGIVLKWLPKIHLINSVGVNLEEGV